MTEYPKFQINLDGEHGMFTVRADSAMDLKRQVLEIVGTEVELNKVFDHVKAGFTKLASGEMKGKGGGGFGGSRSYPPRAEKVYTGPPCKGHGEPTERVEGKRGPFYACRAKDAKGDFYWKSGEGCKPENITE